MSLGLKRGTVQLEPHDKQWDEVAIQTIKILKSILGNDAIDIQHIGSTAIPAIKTKKQKIIKISHFSIVTKCKKPALKVCQGYTE